MIPLVVFGRHMASLNALLAEDQKRGTHAVAHGIAITLAGDDARVRQETTNLERQAAAPTE